jgi:uncharacterized metal-binding protein
MAGELQIYVWFGDRKYIWFIHFFRTAGAKEEYITGTIFYILLVDKYVLTLQHSAVSILGAAMLIHKHQVDDQGSK